MGRLTDEPPRGAGVDSGARARLAALGLMLHGPHPPHSPLLAVVTHNGVAYVSGQLPRIDGKITCLGRLGKSVSLEQGIEAAGICALNALAVVEAALGSLDRIDQFLKVTGFVASSPDFGQQPKVIDGASQNLPRRLRRRRSACALRNRRRCPSARGGGRDRAQRRHRRVRRNNVARLLRLLRSRWRY